MLKIMRVSGEQGSHLDDACLPGVKDMREAKQVLSSKGEGNTKYAVIRIHGYLRCKEQTEMKVETANAG